MKTTAIITRNMALSAWAFLAGAVYLLSSSAGFAAGGETIIDLWGKAVAPKVVELKRIKIDPEKTAFLILDIEELTCNAQRRPRCLSTVPKISRFLDRARKHNVFIVYSLTGRGTPESILADVAPSRNEPVVQSSVDKFYNTEMEEILRDRKIESVIISGTTAEGAVIHTATGAAMRGLKVIVPVDGISAETLYAEQYTCWHLVNAPGSRRSAVLTRFDLIEF